MFVVLSGRSRDNSCSPLTVPVRWVACKGGLCFNPSRRLARLAGAPSFHVNRPLHTMLSDLTLIYPSNRSFNIPPLRAYPGRLTPLGNKPSLLLWRQVRVGAFEQLFGPGPGGIWTKIFQRFKCPGGSPGGWLPGGGGAGCVEASI